MTKAGANEKRFRKLISDQFGKGLLQDSQTYKNHNANVSISVDEFIEINGRKILFEIDSGNYAKLLVGQYVLLNQIIEDQKNVLFVLVHYYNQYNEERTRKNLQFINEGLYKQKGIPFKAFTAESFENEIKQYGTIEKFVEVQFLL